VYITRERPNQALPVKSAGAKGAQSDEMIVGTLSMAERGLGPWYQAIQLELVSFGTT
jgi:hypothetical protein